MPLPRESTILRDPPTPPITRWGHLWRALLVLGFGLLAWSTVVASAPVDTPAPLVAWHLSADPLLGLAMAVLVIFRRRWPARVALIVTLVGMVSSAAGGAVFLALASVATRRRWRELAWLVPLNVVSGLAIEEFYPSADAATPWFIMLILIILIISVTVAVGYAVGGRRELVRERVEAAELDAQRRAGQAAAAERTRIAREMHDVLAHRISLIAMHAGALNFRTDLSAEQMRETTATIEANAHQALQDLREVLGVLREPRGDSAGAPEPPQPGLADIPALIAEAQALGTRITVLDETHESPPKGLGRTAYRVIQEALTNARKHAPGAVVRVRLAGGPLAGLQVEITNPRAIRPLDHALPRSGLGLLGLQERVALAGGQLRHGNDPDGGYAVRAWLPWPAPEAVAPQQDSIRSAS